MWKKCFWRTHITFHTRQIHFSHHEETICSGWDQSKSKKQLTNLSPVYLYGQSAMQRKSYTFLGPVQIKVLMPTIVLKSRENYTRCYHCLWAEPVCSPLDRNLRGLTGAVSQHRLLDARLHRLDPLGAWCESTHKTGPGSRCPQTSSICENTN